MKRKIFFAVMAIVLVSTVSCEKFLDKIPDNRTEINTPEKMQSLLVSAYPATDFMLITEFMSDNVDDYGKNNPYTDRFIDQVTYWEDVTENDNESPENLWANSYAAIAAANEVLAGLEASGGATTRTLEQIKAEALFCRAYSHFVLVNVFCKAYNPETSSSDLGIPYIEAPETTLDSDVDRGTVAEVYQKIDRDIQEALPLQGDSYFTVPKYHFNQKAAFAFAARFYLYWQKWDLALEYADKCLGTSPETLLRDWAEMKEMTQTYAPIVQHFIQSSLNCNLLLMTAYSKMGLAFGPYFAYSRYAHGNYLATTEDGMATNIWGNAEYYQGMKVYRATNLDKTLFWKLPYLFEYTDAVAGIGYYRTVYPAFWADETLLVRAEAKAMLDDFDGCCADLTLWMQNIVDTDLELRPMLVRNFFNTAYWEWNAPTLKKHLHPSFSLGEENGQKEALIQCVLLFRRIETLGQGLRWFDIKRYGIDIHRRIMNSKGEPDHVEASLMHDDERTAVQIPLKVRAAGLEANPR